jgi:hypothetical protein
MADSAHKRGYVHLMICAVRHAIALELYQSRLQVYRGTSRMETALLAEKIFLIGWGRQSTVHHPWARRGPMSVRS